jgi:hypothetical protein
MPPNQAECDFCATPNPIFVFPTHAFTLASPNVGDPLLENGEGGLWAACEVCAGHIEARDPDGLTGYWSLCMAVSGQRVTRGGIQAVATLHVAVIAHVAGPLTRT